MLHGQVIRPPFVGATLDRVDEDSVKGMPGLVKVVIRKNFVGVVAEKPWQAIQAASKLKVMWTRGAALPNFESFHETLRTQKPTRDTFTVNTKDVDEKIAGAAKVVKATYLYPYQMHGSFASSCAVAEVQGERATIWSATQAVYPLRDSAAMMLGLRPRTCMWFSAWRQVATVATARTRCPTMPPCSRRPWANPFVSSFLEKTKWPGKTTAMRLCWISVSAWTPQATSSRGIMSPGLR